MNLNKLNYISLTNLKITLEVGVKQNYITKEDKSYILKWKKSTNN